MFYFTVPFSLTEKKMRFRAKDSWIIRTAGSQSHFKDNQWFQNGFNNTITKTVDSVEGALWLASKTTNILCSYYLPPRNSGKNSVHVCVCDNWRNHPNQFFVVYIISLFKYILKQLFTSGSVASGGYCSCGYYSRLWIVVLFFSKRAR